MPNYKLDKSSLRKAQDTFKNSYLLGNGNFLSTEMLEMLEEKIYNPYMISKSTEIHFGDRLSQVNSFIDILKTFSSLKQSRIKFYFKVETEEMPG